MTKYSVVYPCDTLNEVGTWYTEKEIEGKEEALAFARHHARPGSIEEERGHLYVIFKSSLEEDYYPIFITFAPNREEQKPFFNLLDKKTDHMIVLDKDNPNRILVKTMGGQFFVRKITPINEDVIWTAAISRVAPKVEKYLEKTYQEEAME